MGELPSSTDVLVIGGGPGGYAAAFRAADLGHEVTIVGEDERLGGVCLLRGCIPSKTLLSVSELIRDVQDAASRGVDFGKPKIDIEKLAGWCDEVVDGLADGLSALTEKRGIHFVSGRARFVGSRKVRVQGADVGSIEFSHAIVATGSRSVALPDTEFHEGGRIMDSTGALALRDIPERLLVIGGGYVGLELGQVYARAGSNVTLVEATEQLLPGVDQELVGVLKNQLEDDFAQLHLKAEIAGLEERDEGVIARLSRSDGNDEQSFDRVLVAIGRRPNSDDLGLEETQIEIDDKGFVKVNEQQRTADERIFAIGDVTAGMQLAHEAMAHARVAAEAIAGRAAAFDARAVPVVVYTDPQIACCGVTDTDSDGIRVVRAPWRSSGRARTIGAGHGLTKLFVNPDDGRIRGLGVVGHDAEALIAEGVLAIELGAVAEDLGRIIHPHPTLNETIGEAADAFLGMPIHMPPAQNGRRSG